MKAQKSLGVNLSNYKNIVVGRVLFSLVGARATTKDEDRPSTLPQALPEVSKTFPLGRSPPTPFSVFGYSPGSGGHKTQNVSFPLPGETPEVTQRREWKRKSFVTAGKTWPTNVDWNPMPGLSSSLWAGRLQGFPPISSSIGHPLTTPLGPHGTTLRVQGRGG